MRDWKRIHMAFLVARVPCLEQRPAKRALRRRIPQFSTLIACGRGLAGRALAIGGASETMGQRMPYHRAVKERPQPS
jgi:hypothetical protein